MDLRMCVRMCMRERRCMRLGLGMCMRRWGVVPHRTLTLTLALRMCMHVHHLALYLRVRMRRSTLHDAQSCWSTRSRGCVIGSSSQHPLELLHPSPQRPHILPHRPYALFDSTLNHILQPLCPRELLRKPRLQLRSIRQRIKERLKRRKKRLLLLCIRAGG